MAGFTRVFVAVLTVLMLGEEAAAQAPVGGNQGHQLLVERGHEIARRWCSDCHSTAAVGAAADVGPSFPHVAHTRSREFIRGFLANPHVRGRMPPFDLSRQQIEELLAYIESPGRGTIRGLAS